MTAVSNSGTRNAESSAKPIEDPLSPDQKKFLSTLLDELAEDDSPAHDALLKANPVLVEHCGQSDIIRERIRAVLVGQEATTLWREQERLIEQANASAAQRRARTAPASSLGRVQEPAGILTSMTRKLPPDRAIELYRKIAPTVVHQLLNELYPSANLAVVQRFVDHLCSADVQVRLRACDHVRDGILHELCMVLGQPDIRQEVDREDLQRVLEECGAMDGLIAMENCIRVAASKAS